MRNFSEITLCIDNINKKISKIKSEKISRLGIKNTHFNCMMHIYAVADGLTPTEIARSCNVDKAFVSRISADLIKGDLICINEKFNDGRKYRNKYILTQKGISVICDVKSSVEEYFAELESKIGERAMNAFADTAALINDFIKNQIEE